MEKEKRNNYKEILICVYNDTNGIVRDLLFEKDIIPVCIQNESDLNFANTLGFKTIIVDQMYNYNYIDKEVYNRLKEMGFKFKKFNPYGDWVEYAVNEGFTYSDIYGKWCFDEDKEIEPPKLNTELFDYCISLDEEFEKVKKDLNNIIENE